MPGGDVTGSDPICGVVGKLPAHGDFVRRGGPGTVLGQIDAWLDRELAGAVAAGIALDDAVVALDGWRFASVGSKGPVIAVAIASGDAVDRMFPMVATLTGAATDRAAAERWCVAAAGALVEVRDGGRGADAALAALSAIAPPTVNAAATTGWWHPDLTGGAGGGVDLPTGAAFRSLLSWREP